MPEIYLIKESTNKNLEGIISEMNIHNKNDFKMRTLISIRNTKIANSNISSKNNKLNKTQYTKELSTEENNKNLKKEEWNLNKEDEKKIRAYNIKHCELVTDVTVDQYEDTLSIILHHVLPLSEEIIEEYLDLNLNTEKEIKNMKNININLPKHKTIQEIANERRI